MGGFPGYKSGQALQLARCPGNLYAWKREFRSNTLEARKHKLFPLAALGFTEDAVTTSSFSYRPMEQRQGVGKKIRIAVKL